MFKRILVPLDGSFRAEQALPVAARIAHATDASLLLLRVVTTISDFALQTMEWPVDVEAVLDEERFDKTYDATIVGVTPEQEAMFQCTSLVRWVSLANYVGRAHHQDRKLRSIQNTLSDAPHCPALQSTPSMSCHDTSIQRVSLRYEQE